MEPKTRYTFKKGEKLKSRKTIEQLFREGRSFSNFPFRVLWNMIEGQGPGLQTGFAVSSKHFKKAVDRNRIKRLMREAYRLQKNELQQALSSGNRKLVVFIIYTGNELPDHSFMSDKTQRVLNRLIKLIHENNLADT